LRLGDTEKALQAYQQALNISQALAESDPTNVSAQRDLSVSYNRIGDVQLRLGDTEKALQAYQQALEIRQALAESGSDPSKEIRQALAKSGSDPSKFIKLTKILALYDLFGEFQQDWRRAVAIG
jgi:tetratricopeptide (TPR) repeat protein